MTESDQQGQWRSRAVAALIVAVLVVAVSSSIGSGDDDGRDGDDEIGAWIACQEFVERQLRAPATAQFPSRSSVEVERTTTGWEISGHVDAENAMGATLRADFTCQARLDGDTWVGRAQLAER